MREVSGNLNELIEANRGDISAVGENLKTMTERLDRSAADLEELIAKMNRGDGTVARLVNEGETVDRVNEALDSVDDSLAAADTFFRRVGEARFSFEWRSEFYDRISATKNYFGVRLEFGDQSSGRGFEFHLIDDNIGGLTQTNILSEFFDPETGELINRTLERQLVRQEGFRVNALLSPTARQLPAARRHSGEPGRAGRGLLRRERQDPSDDGDVGPRARPRSAPEVPRAVERPRALLSHRRLGRCVPPGSAQLLPRGRLFLPPVM